jgi:hypothetical protein
VDTSAEHENPFKTACCESCHCRYQRHWNPEKTSKPRGPGGGWGPPFTLTKSRPRQRPRAAFQEPKGKRQRTRLLPRSRAVHSGAITVVPGAWRSGLHSSDPPHEGSTLWASQRERARFRRKTHENSVFARKPRSSEALHGRNPKGAPLMRRVQ